MDTRHLARTTCPLLRFFASSLPRLREVRLRHEGVPEALRVGDVLRGLREGAELRVAHLASERSSRKPPIRSCPGGPGGLPVPSRGRGWGGGGLRGMGVGGVGGGVGVGGLVGGGGGLEGFNPSQSQNLQHGP